MSKRRSIRDSKANNRALRDCVAAALGLAVTFGPTGPAAAREIQRSNSSAANAAAAAAASATKLVIQTAPIIQRAQTALAQTTQALQAVQALQNQAAAAALKAAASNGANGTTGWNGLTANLPSVPDGLATGGLQPDSGVNGTSTKGDTTTYAISPTWTGISELTQTTTKTAAGTTKTVTITQDAENALLFWTTFNVGKNTILDFDQTLGGSNVDNWIAFNIVNDPSTNPSQILGQIRSGSFTNGKFTPGGQVYLINQNGILFGGSSQVNTHALVASGLAINSNLAPNEFQDNGLLNTPIFSSCSLRSPWLPALRRPRSPPRSAIRWSRPDN